ncbi:hypothetical protein OsJ_02761 [Oryza sativa Japonica Group]|uniref:Uncharacterized protein n=1 Tax=Oryza sativa subsp. japonica TaxID=39947 RepID=A2ZVU3_ORYSJ|nr:hypothetical protein OsJ_02761 [Oryza sativa Japonica Group]
MAAVLDALIVSCIKKLQDIITDNAILVLGVEEELSELVRKTDYIRCSLNDAETTRLDHEAVNNWLGQLRDVMYDVDDIIDLARFKGSILLADHPSSSSSKPTRCNCPSCHCNIWTRHEVAVKIRSLNKKIANISNDELLQDLRRRPHPRNGSIWTPIKTSSIVEPNLVGEEVILACRELVDLVIENKEKKDYKLGIVGTGGVGKTTLAQQIYNDEKITGNFDKHAWVCVSTDSTQTSLLEEVLRIMKIRYGKAKSVEELQNKLKSAIKEKSFFLVLDDVWESNAWTNSLQKPLHAAAKGIVIVTTRNEKVAQEIKVDHTHQVHLMSENVGWDLLWKSMGITEEKQVHHLRDIGIEIVHQCGYLPLAIKIIAKVLISKEKTNDEWKRILSNNSWSMNNLPDELRALYLSYSELSHQLKQCFLYCAIYPEHSTINRDDLTSMWVAEGFIDEQKDQLLEDTAVEYYNELIHWNLLQLDLSYFDLGGCKMHGLLRQLVCYLSREECFVGDPESQNGNTMSKMRRVSVVTEKDTVVLPSMDKKQYKVRTYRTSYSKSLRVYNPLFKRLTYLRVLDLTGTLVQSIPSHIGNLIHMRLINLDGTNISCLPESVGNLQNLQVLNLQRCKSLYRLPLATTKLCNLRRLGLLDTPINKVPKGIGRLQFLNDLEGFPIGSVTYNKKMQDGWNLEDLADLSQLRRLVMLPNLERLKIVKATAITKIGPEFIGQFPRSREAVAFPKLEWLIINDMPNWEEWAFIEEDEISLAAMNEGGGDGTAVAEEEEISLAAMNEGGEDGTTVTEKGEASFPRLCVLPSLKRLDIDNCPKLRALPQQLGHEATSLKELSLVAASCLKSVKDLPSLSGFLSVCRCEGLERVTELPKVRKLFVVNLEEFGLCSHL